VGALQVIRAGLLLVLLALAPWWARAFTTVSPTGAVGVVYGPSSVQLVDGAGATTTYIGRNFADANAVARTVGLTESYSAQVGGRAVAVNVARTLTAGEVAAAAVAVGAVAWGACAVGTAIAEYGQGTRIHCNVADQWLFDPGQDPGHTTVTCWGFNSSQCFGSAQAALNSVWVAGTPVENGKAETGWCDKVDNFHYVCARPYKVPGENFQRFQGQVDVYVVGQSDALLCPAVTDQLDPRYDLPAGSPPGPDGKCPTGRYGVVPPSVAADQLGRYGNPAVLPQVAEQTLAKGQPIETASPRAVTGPASITGTPTTTSTTNADGSVSSVTTTPTYNYHYDGDTITYNTTYVTVTNNNGQTTTTTTTGDDPKQKSECELHPDTVGCMKPGDLPTDAPQWQTKNVEFVSEDLGLGGSCPAPRHMSIRGWDLVLDYQPACDVAPVVRVALLALTALGCLLMIIKTVKA